jgi:NAD(P)-dependent dehydrogenase (short-subunit alcohol dehydrogenase family)
VIGAYNISKAADLQLVRNLAAEYGPSGVRVNAICPGLIRTDFARALWENPDILKLSTAGSALKRIGEPTRSPAWPCSWPRTPAASPTGQAMVIDGGATIM